MWWGAMKETIVKDWIQISINAILCIGVVRNEIQIVLNKKAGMPIRTFPPGTFDV